MRRLVLPVLIACGTALAASAQAPADAGAAYAEAVACAGKFRWVLDASSGGQPALNEYSLEERVKGVEVYTQKAEAAGAAVEPTPDVARDIQAVADDTIGAFFDDPDTVESELLACAIAIGMREE